MNVSPCFVFGLLGVVVGALVEVLGIYLAYRYNRWIIQKKEKWWQGERWG